MHPGRHGERPGRARHDRRGRRPSSGCSARCGASTTRWWAIGMSGQAALEKVAGPVGEALVMTAAGLAVALAGRLRLQRLHPVPTAWSSRISTPSPTTCMPSSPWGNPWLPAAPRCSRCSRRNPRVAGKCGGGRLRWPWAVSILPAGTQAPMAEINTTPLVDVMLVLADHLHHHRAADDAFGAGRPAARLQHADAREAADAAGVDHRRRQRVPQRRKSWNGDALEARFRGRRGARPRRRACT